MKTIKSIGVLGIVLLILGACGPSTTNLPSETATVSSATAALPTTPTSTIVPIETREPPPFPFSERGPYWTGNRVYTFIDESRDGRRIEVQIYYPALKEANEQGGTITRNATADMSGAPYPLILTDNTSGNVIFRSHLASYGFVMALVNSPDSYAKVDFQVMDHPLDFLFALDQIGLDSLEGLEGVIDANNTGVSGFSGGGWMSMALSGVRIDPEYYLSFCENAPTMEPKLSAWYIDFYCNLARKWEAFALRVAPEIKDSEDGLWQPVTDERIRAIMPMAPDGAILYGDQGLAAMDLPTLIIAPVDDQYTPYDFETVFIYEQLGSSEKSIISFIGKDHDMPYMSEPANRMKHFAVAFFGYYLQGHKDYAYYFSEDFVSQVDDLAWGIYTDE